MDNFWGNIFRREQEEQDTQALLKKIPIFATLTGRELAAVQRILYRREYQAGEVVFRQNEPGVGMYIVQRGVVSIIYEPTGRLLVEMRDGDFFGEVALLNETPRSAMARARTDCVLLGVFQPELLGLIEREPALGVKVLLALAQITGKRLIRLSDEAQALREELLACRAGQVDDVDPELAAADAAAEHRGPAEPVVPHQTAEGGHGAPDVTLD